MRCKTLCQICVKLKKCSLRIISILALLRQRPSCPIIHTNKYPTFSSNICSINTLGGSRGISDKEGPVASKILGYPLIYKKKSNVQIYCHLLLKSTAYSHIQKMINREATTYKYNHKVFLFFCGAGDVNLGASQPNCQKKRAINI